MGILPGFLATRPKTHSKEVCFPKALQEAADLPIGAPRSLKGDVLIHPGVSLSGLSFLLSLGRRSRRLPLSVCHLLGFLMHLYLTQTLSLSCHCIRSLHPVPPCLGPGLVPFHFHDVFLSFNATMIQSKADIVILFYSNLAFYTILGPILCTCNTMMVQVPRGLLASSLSPGVASLS